MPNVYVILVCYEASGMFKTRNAFPVLKQTLFLESILIFFWTFNQNNLVSTTIIYSVLHPLKLAFIKCHGLFYYIMGDSKKHFYVIAQ